MPAVPHRHLARGRPRVDAGVIDRVPPPLEAHMRLGPQLLHDLDLLFGAAATIVEGLVETGELDLVPADADAEPETAAALRIEAGHLFRYEHGLPLRQYQNAGRKAELRGAAGEKAKEHERVVVQPRPGAAGLRRAGFTGAEYMVRRLDKVVADRLRGLRVFPHHRRITADIAQRQQHTQLHRSNSLWFSSTGSRPVVRKFPASRENFDLDPQIKSDPWRKISPGQSLRCPPGPRFPRRLAGESQGNFAKPRLAGAACACSCRWPHFPILDGILRLDLDAKMANPALVGGAHFRHVYTAGARPTTAIIGSLTSSTHSARRWASISVKPAWP